jgi:rRNA maturation RNase YbeY
VAFVEEAAMVELNKRYRGLDAPTDVLSFDYSADTGWPSEPGDGLRGEVVVCPSVVIQYAREEGRDAKEQLAWTLIHGALHLAGHDHETDRGEMREREEQLRGYLEGVVTSLSLGKGH